MKRALLALLVLAACSTFSDMEAGLNALVGQPISAAVDKLGYPDAETEMMGDTVYIWDTNFQMTVPQVATSNTYGSVGTVPYSGYTTYTTSSTYNYSCVIRVFVDGNERIKTWDFEGNIGGCGDYASRLKG